MDVHPRRIFCPHTQDRHRDAPHSVELDSMNSISHDRGISGTSYRQPAQGSDRPRTDTRVRRARGTSSQRGHESRNGPPRPHPEFETYNRYCHNDTLRQTNPGATVPPRSPGQVWQLYGQPRAMQRNIDRPTGSQKLHATNPDLTSTSKADFDLAGLAISEQSDGVDCHQERVANFERLCVHGLRHTSAGFQDAEPQSLRMHDIIRQFNFVRRGSGKRAKFRESVKQWLKIERDHTL